MKIKNTKRSMLLSALSLLLCVSMFVGTTYAWFTDTVVSGNNKIVAGNLDIELEYYTGEGWATVSGATNLFEDALWEPGYTEVVYLRLNNLGTLALKYELAINVVSETPGINVEGEEFLLSDYIYMGVVEGQKPSFASRSEAQNAATATAGIISEGYVADGQMTADQDDIYMAVVVYMPTATGNEANYRGETAPSIDLGINLVATQLMNESDDFNNEYDANAKYLIKSDEKMIFTGNDFDTTIINNGIVNVIGGTIETNKVGLQNYGNATLTDVVVNAGSANDYAGISYAGSVTEYNNVVLNSAGGGIGARDGAQVTFNSGSVYVDTASTSGRYIFYTEGAGTVITINGGSFSWDPADNQKRAYIYASADTTVYVNGGTFGKASTRSGYTDGILGDGTVIITGGTFGFNPTKWVADGYQAIKNGATWVVVPEEVTAIVNNATQLQTALDSATDGAVIYVNGTITGDVTATQKADVKVTIDGNGNTFAGVLLVDGKSATYTTAGLTIKDFVFKADSISADACIQLGDGTNATRYTCNVTVDGCTFDVPGAVGVKSYTGGDKNLIITGCTATENAHSLAQLKGIDGVLVENCKVYSKNGLNFNNSDNVTVDGCEVDVKGYAVRFGESSGGAGAAETYTIKNSTLKSQNDDGDATIILRGTADNATLTIVSTTIVGTPDIANTANNATVVK